jgi:hypothetical protein
MEGRCLLSAVTLQFSPLSAPGIVETTQFNPTTVIGGQQSALSVIAEGGFIDLGGLQSQSMNDYVPAVTAGAGGAGVGVSFGGPTVTDILGADLYELPPGNSTANPLTLFDTAGGGFSMRPIVISPSVGLSDAMPRVDPGRSGSLIPSQVRGGQEGGLVQIDTILEADKRFDTDRFAISAPVDDPPDQTAAPESPPSHGAKSLAATADSDARQPAFASAASTELAVSLDQPATAPVSPKSSVISGELARAMVFEMAGGEPAWIRPVVTSEKIKGVAPTVGQNAPRADVPPLSPAVAQQAALRASGSRIRITGNQVEFPLPADAWQDWSRVANTQAVTQHANGKSYTGGRFAAFNAPDVAVAEVFEQLGGAEEPVARSSFEDDAGSGPLVAGAVIALLILERAAARYKTRDEREILTVVAGPPRI